MSNGSNQADVHGATTVGGAVPTIPIAPSDFTRPEIQDDIDGAMAMVPLPAECSDRAWNQFGGALATAMEDTPFSTVFVGDNPWRTVYDWLKRMTPDKRSRFLRWFFSGVVPGVGLVIGETLAKWMTKGIFPTTVEIESRKPADRAATAVRQIAKFGHLIAQIVPESVKEDGFLRGGARIINKWGDVRFIHAVVNWTTPNKALHKLLEPAHGAWEHAWTVLRDMVEWVVDDETIMFQQQLKLWYSRKIIAAAAIPIEGGSTRLAQIIKDTLQEGIEIGSMTTGMKEHTRWVCHCYLGAMLASAVRDQTQHSDPFPNPAEHLLRVCEEGFWPLGVQKEFVFFLCDLFGRQ